jgi:hypothetical protein
MTYNLNHTGNITHTIEIGPKTGKVIGKAVTCLIAGPAIVFTTLFGALMIDIHVLKNGPDHKLERACLRDGGAWVMQANGYHDCK